MLSDKEKDWLLKNLVGFYGVYILFLGFAASIMDTPKEKAAGYLIVSSILTLVLIIGIEIILRVFLLFGESSELSNFAQDFKKWVYHIYITFSEG